MDLTPEQLTAFIAIGFGIVRVLEWGAKSLYALATGKKDTMASMAEMLSKATNNHLHTIQDAVVTAVEQHKQQLIQGEKMIAQHEKQNETTAELVGYLKGKLSK